MCVQLCMCVRACTYLYDIHYTYNKRHEVRHDLVSQNEVTNRCMHKLNIRCLGFVPFTACTLASYIVWIPRHSLCKLSSICTNQTRFMMRCGAGKDFALCSAPFITCCRHTNKQTLLVLNQRLEFISFLYKLNMGTNQLKQLQ